MAKGQSDLFDPWAHPTRNASDSAWEDEEPVDHQPSPPREALGVYQGHETTSRPVSTSTRSSSIQKVRRLKSRQRQKAQNAHAGIKLVTNLSQYRRNRSSAHARRPTVFANPTALSALEGLPVSALSPEDRPIMIGISSDAHPNLRSPFTPKGTSSRNQQSVWSPDTPSTVYSSISAASSVYSQVTLLPAVAFTPPSKAIPPVPAMPKIPPTPPRQNPQVTGKKNVRHAARVAAEEEDDDGGSPFTLFEEDGDRRAAAAVAAAQRAAAVATPPSTAGASSPTWWLQSSNTTPQSKASRGTTGTEWWNKSPPPTVPLKHIADAAAAPFETSMPVLQEAPKLRVPTPHRTPSPAASQAASLYTLAHASSESTLLSFEPLDLNLLTSPKSQSDSILLSLQAVNHCLAYPSKLPCLRAPHPRYQCPRGTPIAWHHPRAPLTCQPYPPRSGPLSKPPGPPLLFLPQLGQIPNSSLPHQRRLSLTGLSAPSSHASTPYLPLARGTR